MIMKKKIMILGLIIAVSACGKESKVQEEYVKSNGEVIATQTVPTVNETVIFNFKRADNNEIITLKTSNSFETAILKIGDKIIELEENVSGSGTRMVNKEAKIEIIFNRKEGVLTLDGKNVNLMIVE